MSNGQNYSGHITQPCLRKKPTGVENNDVIRTGFEKIDGNDSKAGSEKVAL